ncbi:MAG: glycosyltransferase [Anaerolineae bacterium]|jgi:glycosyltransferase involved in cell wall biosynthesis|nr:glycosyltransferase [Anaerolineae bacterium]MDH7473681.1 glycosyltransferase [Anaerolineae bacterium]
MPIIAYVSQQFPCLTMTFIYREVLALRRYGLTIRPISTWRPPAGVMSEEAVELIGETFYIFPLPWLRLLGNHLHYLLTRPGRYLGTLGRLVLFNREPLRHRLRLLVHFIYAVRAAAEIERCQAQHIHADFALNAATVAMVASWLTGRPFSFTAHAADIFVDPILLREKIAAASFVVSISEYNKRHLVSIAGDNGVAGKIHLVHYGLNIDQFTPNPNRKPNAVPVLLTVGRLVEKKGLQYLVKACRILVEQGYEFECLIVGQGPEEKMLRQLIREYGLGERVHLLGAMPQERVRELFRRADLFVLPCVVASNGDRDGIPVVLIEAMAMGLPVVSTSLSGIPELIENGVSGWVVSPHDEEELAGAMAKLLRDPHQRARMGAVGRRKVLEEFNIERSAAQLCALFNGSTTGRCEAVAMAVEDGLECSSRNGSV